MNTLQIENYDLKLTLLSGQAFNWEYLEGWFYGKFINRIIKIRQEKNKIYWQTYPKKDDLEFITNYLQLDHDYESIIKDITKDLYVNESYKKYPNLRLIKQELEQSIFSYILASNKNIKSIRTSIEKLCKMNNNLIIVDDKEFFSFPQPDFFENVTITDLLSTGVGYRAEYIKDLASKIYTDNFLGIANNLIKQEDQNKIRDHLKTVKGIGDKIADCILVFSLGFYNLTPIDIWGDRIIEEMYGEKNLKNYNSKRNWFTNKFGQNTAWAGQYLFEYIRNYSPDNYIQNEK